MGKIIRFSLIFGICGVIVSMVLSYSNSMTEDSIAEKELEVKLEMRKAVLKNAESFDVEKTKKSTKYEFVPGINKNKKIIGYVTEIDTEGFGGKIRFLLGLTPEGKVTGIKILESKGETRGLGYKINDEKWLEHWIGKDDRYEFDRGVDAFAGASISPRAVYRGIKSAASELKTAGKASEQVIVTATVDNAAKEPMTPEKQQLIVKIKDVLKDTVNCQMTPIVINNNKYYICYDNNGKKIGCMADIVTDGYGGQIKILLGISVDSKVSGLKVTEAGGEKPDAHDLITNSIWQSKWIGRDKNYTFNESVDAIAGATISPTCVNDAVKKALTDSEKLPK